MKTSGLAAVLFLVLSTGVATAAPSIEVEIAQDDVEAVLGETVLLDVTVQNLSDRSTGPLLGHLVVVDPEAKGSADAEDWTDTLTMPIAGLDPGESVTVSWDVAPISAGQFFVMVVVVAEDPGFGSGVSSNTVFEVSQSAESLQATVLPISIAGPVAVGAIGWMLVRRERRRVEELVSAA